METFVLEAKPRTDIGTRAARRMRSQGLLPANVYGHKQDNVLVALDAKEFRRFFDAGHRILTLRVEGQEERNVVKEIQYDAFGSEILHVDLTRVSRDERIEMEVPIETIGIAKGTSGGGVLEFPLKDVLVGGLADDIPERIEVNIEELEVGQALRVKDLPKPQNCEFVQEPELLVLHVTAPRGAEEGAPATEEEPSMPEVIGKKKAEDEEGSTES